MESHVQLQRELKDEAYQGRFRDLLARAVAELEVEWADSNTLAEPPTSPDDACRCAGTCWPWSRALGPSPNDARSPSQGFLCWSEVESKPLLGYTAMPPQEQEVAAHLPMGPSGAPQLPSKAGLATVKLADKSYRAAGQAAAMANNLATLLAYQEALLADLRDGASPDVVMELRMLTDYVLSMVACVARDVGKIMTFSAVTHRLSWLSSTALTEKARKAALAAPVSPAILFGSAGGLVELLQAQHLSMGTRPCGRGRPPSLPRYGPA